MVSGTESSMPTGPRTQPQKTRERKTTRGDEVTKGTLVNDEGDVGEKDTCLQVQNWAGPVV
jgi:hypothetical protein